MHVSMDEWKCLNFDPNSSEYVPKGLSMLSDHKSALIWVMAGTEEATSLLPEPVVFTSTYSRQYSESLAPHSWLEPISARRGLGKPASRLTSLGELN